MPEPSRGFQEGEARLYLGRVLENVTDVVTILDAAGKVLYESPAITAVLGYAPDELVGQNAFAFIHPEDRPSVFKTFLDNVMHPAVVKKVEVRFRHKDGQWVMLESVAKNLLFDPHVKGIVVSSRDITERLRAEDQTRLQISALEAAHNGIVITDPKGTILWVNSAFTRMTGYAPQEVIGQNPRILKSGEQRPEFYKELWDTILAGRVWSGEFINRRKDGGLYFERTTITPVLNRKKKITHFIAVKDDVSADKKLESQLRQAQKMEVVGQLAGGVAHDFNNLLTVIIGQSEMLLSALPEGSDQREPLEEILKMGRRAANLTSRLLAFSRKQPVHLEATDLNGLVRGADKMIRRLLGENIEMVTLFGEGLPKVHVDDGQMEQAILNLAVNARDAMPGGGKLVLETSIKVLDYEAAARHPGLSAGEYVMIAVSDTGCGMTAEVMAHLFEPFFTTKELGKGTGLGLATVYGIVQQCGGGIDVESAPQKGSTFRIYLPPVREPAGRRAEASVQKLPRGSETVLVAEDEDLVRELCASVLTKQGFQVLKAKNGQEALQIAAELHDRPVDLLMTDMVMPFMGGSELAEKFRPKFPKARILFTSGYVDHSVVQRWLDQGCLFLQKPYTPVELLKAVRDALDGPPIGVKRPA